MTIENYSKCTLCFLKRPLEKSKKAQFIVRKIKKWNCENRSSAKLARYNIVKGQIYAARPAFHFVSGRVNRAQNLL